MIDKKVLRRDMRRLRRAISDEQARQAARHLARELSRNPRFLAARNIAFYWAADGEIDPALLLRLALLMKKQVFLPVLDPLFGRSLRFARLRPGTAMRANRFGIPEPLVPRRALMKARQVDLILTPLVAFDPQGGRLGMGGGFYDRALQHLGWSRLWRRPHVIGLAYELQKVPQLPRESWDIALDGIQTEQAWYPATA